MYTMDCVLKRMVRILNINLDFYKVIAISDQNLKLSLFPQKPLFFFEAK